MSRTTNTFSPEVRERPVRMVVEHAGAPTSHWTAHFHCGQDRLRAPHADEWIKKPHYPNFKLGQNDI